MLEAEEDQVTDETTIIELSENKWRWMAERDVEALDGLFDERARFVHMGATMTRQQELDVIREGHIEYRETTVHERSVPFLSESTAIMLTRLDLVAVVGGNEVTNPFMVTEVFVHEDGWKLASMSFTRLLTPQ
ncbi:MAG: nuclear transport factor 2 family protein [Propionibacteriaceae bacterium]|nr:nuclear transport factor 2 family protein [Propionibacteriaceae bacterium]